MKLHENTSLYRDAIRFTAQQMDIQPEYVEKDYWVTYVLFTIFNNEIGKDTVFKGGTALSKCYNIIERFSEDIDLVVLRKAGESNNQLTAKIKTISKIVKEVLPEINIEGLTRKRGMNRKTVHSFKQEFLGDYGQVRKEIVIEASWLGYHEPYSKQTVSSLVYDMMVDTGQVEIAKEYELLPFNVQVLEPRRTICEKIMSLVRFSYDENPIDALSKKVRHTYDLYQLLQQQKYSDFLDSPEFEKMLLKVANDDVLSFKNNNEWLAYHPIEALIFKDLDNVWNELKKVYNVEFREMVYGILPNENDVLAVLKRIKKRIETIIWLVEIKNTL